MEKKSKNSNPALLDSASFQLERVEEFLLDSADVKKIQTLLTNCFPEYPQKTIYFNQLPSFRYLAQFNDQLIGHMGVDFRVINNGGQLCKVLCISDVCVDEEYRDQQIASKMLQILEEDAKQKEVDFCILIANADSKIYQHLGYQGCSNHFRWMMIQQKKSMGIVQRNLGSNVFMMKAISDKKWSEKTTDLLGPIF